jgi:pre-rRNA-processing protein TSR1
VKSKWSGRNLTTPASLSARPSWQSHPLVLAERVQRADKAEAEAGCSEGEVVIGITGYVRGSALNPNQLIHIPSQGSYQITKITVHSDPCPVGKAAGPGAARDEDVFPDATEELAMDNAVDDMDAEQTWPTEEELQGAKERVRAPKGSGQYQASWFRTIDDDDCGEHLDEEDEEGEEDEDESGDDESEVSEPPEEVIIDDDDDDDDAMTEAGGETMVGGEEFLDRYGRQGRVLCVCVPCC